jgi:putative NIF3 family GTP cyclohydrolase 1 type 2
MNRRHFTAIAALAPIGSAAEGPLTAEAAIARIQSALGGDLPPTTPDGLKAGNPSTVVKGIATTAMATLDVLKQAAAANANLILTYEPTFYGRADTGPPGDPVVKAKREFIEKNALVVYRLRDRWQARKGDEMIAGLADALGWSKRRIKPDEAIYEIPAATGAGTVDSIRRKLNLRAGLRAVGDRKATIRRVLLHPGPMTPAVMWKRYSEVDMLIAGEVREWENTLYAADMFTAGEKRVLVTIGRVVSEDPGMRACAQWLKTVVPEVPSKWIGADDPYWRPA